MGTSNIYDIQLNDFDTQVLQASHRCPILVDFWADWCSPCIAIAPVLKSVITNYEGEIALAKLEVDEGENMKLAGRYQVRGFPTVILFRNGEEQARFSGAQSKSFIKDFIEAN